MRIKVTETTVDSGMEWVRDCVHTSDFVRRGYAVHFLLTQDSEEGQEDYKSADDQMTSGANEGEAPAEGGFNEPPSQPQQEQQQQGSSVEWVSPESHEPQQFFPPAASDPPSQPLVTSPTVVAPMG